MAAAAAFEPLLHQYPCTEWTRVFFFEESGQIIAGHCSAKPEEVRDLIASYQDNDTTFARGLLIEGIHYDVHRFHGDLIYGRRGDANQGEGICLYRFQKPSGTKCFALITYQFPILSAKAIPDLQAFVQANMDKF
ncbi:hypothetical protein PAPYR_8254 [Paratrimastix pyriformis]|uniref:Profilin n=1 Tax=Paratrimastix pyriformis TaxID=342808 RepID=A0ABQ8UGI4_9EUKA|nr:hypothetical protein PAPYR_8254 [Paratrimastix pyriformis]